jgi:hypothetical protein
MKTGTLVASAVASLFLAGVAHADKAAAKGASKSASVHCTGINACKGQGSCAGASNACKSQNSCKGQGWTDAASAKACTDKGGKVVAAADAKAK